MLFLRIRLRRSQTTAAWRLTRAAALRTIRTPDESFLSVRNREAPLIDNNFMRRPELMHQTEATRGRKDGERNEASERGEVFDISFGRLIKATKKDLMSITGVIIIANNKHSLS